MSWDEATSGKKAAGKAPYGSVIPLDVKVSDGSGGLPAAVPYLLGTDPKTGDLYAVLRVEGDATCIVRRVCGKTGGTLSEESFRAPSVLAGWGDLGASAVPARRWVAPHGRWAVELRPGEGQFLVACGGGL